jgi:hypothetical protein
MHVQIEISQPESIVEDLQTLANTYRNEGKYVIAGALYRRAMAVLETVELGQRKQPLLVKILADQAAMLRKMKCGNVAAVVEQYARAVEKT